MAFYDVWLTSVAIGLSLMYMELYWVSWPLSYL